MFCLHICIMCGPQRPEDCTWSLGPRTVDGYEPLWGYASQTQVFYTRSENALNTQKAPLIAFVRKVNSPNDYYVYFYCMCTDVCLHVFLWTPHVQCPKRPDVDIKCPETGFVELLVSTWVLGFKPGSSGRAASALNDWALSSLTNDYS